MRPRIIVIVAAAVAIVASAGCTPEQIVAYQNASPADQQAIIAGLSRQGQSQSADCYQAIDRHWPAGERAWFKQIVHRESRNQPSARNASGASGCAQLMLPLHSRRFNAVGCSPAQWANPDCNIRAALHLRNEAGREPWSL